MFDILLRYIVNNVSTFSVPVLKKKILKILRCMKQVLMLPTGRIILLKELSNEKIQIGSMIGF